MKEKEIEIENGDETVNASKAAESAESKGQDGESRAEGEETAKGEAEQAGNESQEEAKADPLEEANAKIAELTDKYLRSVAEFDNYRKRTLKEKAELILNGGEKAISAILPVLDDMERAIANGKKSDDAAVIREGMELIFSKFLKALESLGVKKIDTDGADFDTDVHEAVAMVPTQDSESKGKVLDCIQTGYKLNDKVIRHAKVAVGQ